MVTEPQDVLVCVLCEREREREGERENRTSVPGRSLLTLVGFFWRMRGAEHGSPRSFNVVANLFVCELLLPK